MSKFTFSSRWMGPKYTVHNKWVLREEDDAMKYLSAGETLKVNSTNINYFGERKFTSGTWIHINPEDETELSAFRFLFPYCPTICLVSGWNYVIESDDVLRTEPKQVVLEYLSSIIGTVPEYCSECE